MFGKIIGIHQLEFLPWLGFFFKVVMSDVFILYDLAQYNKQDFQSRNVVIYNGESIRFFVPVQKHSYSSSMKEIRIFNGQKWEQKIKNQFQTWYKNEPYFEEVMRLFSIIWGVRWDSLCELNYVLIKRVLEYLGIETKIILASTIVDDLYLFNKLSTSEKNLYLCQKNNASKYLSGKAGLSYLDKENFNDNGIEVYYIDYLNDGTAISIVDYLFKYGRETINYIKKFAEIKLVQDEQLN